MTYPKRTAARAKAWLEKRRRGARCRRIRRATRRRWPSYTHCKNCGTRLQGIYCHKCGQYALDIKQTFWRYIDEFFQNTYQYDGRLVSTLRLMFTRPGELSAEFERGRINSYVHPLKLYMFVSIVFFGFVIAFVPSPVDLDGTQSRQETETVQQQPNPQARPGTDAEQGGSADSVVARAPSRYMDVPTRKEYFTIADDVAGEQQDTEDELDEAVNSLSDKAEIGKLLRKVKEATPLVMICLIPLYAGILRWSYRRSGKRYLQCFVFAIHIQTVMLLFISVWIFLSFTGLGFVSWLMQAVMFVYLVSASRRFFARSWFRTVLKSFFTLFWYVFVSALLVLTVLILYLNFFWE